MSKVFGNFFYRDEGDGCISGKFMNLEMVSPAPECAELITDRDFKIPFKGKYTSVWLEDNNQAVHANLKIDFNGHKYLLEWSNPKTKTHFEGQGMLVDGLLVGCYWSV